MNAVEQPQQSFGDWLRQHRRALDLTQAEFAHQVGCSAITLRKLEAEERRPSKQIAERLAEVLQVASDDRRAFLRFARGDPFAAPDASPTAYQVAQQRSQPEAPRHNLPLQLTSFIGREKEIAEVKRLLSRAAGARLLTLTGTGGTGKTRLALQVAAGQLDASAFPDGVWLIELAPLADPALVPQSVAKVLGLRETPGQPITAVLLHDLGPKQTLLVLDNCEHLVAACAELAELLLRACPQLTILATSREALGIAGESAYHVPSLSLPGANPPNSIDAVAQSEAVRLFVERAVGVSPDFALTRENLSAVVQVCRQLDGMPLAIELAVARLRMLPVEQIAARLDDRFRLLTGGKRTALPRHQTLQALIDWSYELLTVAEQTLLRRLAVFAGGWTLEAAEAVGSDDGVSAGEVLDLLGRLIDKSLVQVDAVPAIGGSWYHLLDTIRQYALAKLTASGEADAVRRQHAAYYLTLYERNRTGLGIQDTSARAWFDRAELELDNLRAALSWNQSPRGNAELGLRLSGAVSRLLVGYAEARGWMESALARVDAEGGIDPQARANALWMLGDMDGQMAHYESARAHLTQSLMLFQELGDRPLCANALQRLGWLAREQGDAATARLRLEESLALYRELGDKVGLGGALNTLGEVAVMQGDTAEAAVLLNEALALNREVGRAEGIGWSLNHLGHVAQLKGEYELARQLYEESLVPFRKMHHQYGGAAWAFHGLGETALAQGDATLATRHFRVALEWFRLNGVRAQVAWCLAGLAGVAVLNEEPERAARLWGAAEALRQSIGCRPAPAARATRELMAAAREQLGDAIFDAEWAEGQALTPDQAIAVALGDK
jgi:non-specific serine/threonine protein kinase